MHTIGEVHGYIGPFWQIRKRILMVNVMDVRSSHLKLNIYMPRLDKTIDLTKMHCATLTMVEITLYKSSFVKSCNDPWRIMNEMVQ